MSTPLHQIKSARARSAGAAAKTAPKRRVRQSLRRTLFGKVLKSQRQQARLALLAGAIIFLWIGWYLKLVNHHAALPAVTSVQATFASEPVTIDPAMTRAATTAAEFKSPIRIIIPGVEVDVAVREAPVVNGYWQVFADTAGFGSGSSYPQENGNTVIFAHAREYLFLPLKQATVGQNIYVMTKSGWFVYQIKTIKEVVPSQKEVISPTTDATLTLYTCSGFSDSKRLIVTAKRLP